MAGRFTPSSSELTYRPSYWDGTSDEDIQKLVLSDKPITSTKNVWAFWHSGWDGMKLWRQKNIISWVRRSDPSWTLRLLDMKLDSPRHFLKFLETKELPEALIQNSMDQKARSSAEHASDMIRMPLLYTYGGIWLDVGFFLLHDLEDICWDALNDPDNPHQLCATLMPVSLSGSFMVNGFLASLPGNEFVKNWHKIFCALWEGKTSCVGMSTGALLKDVPQFPMNPVIQAALGGDVTKEAYNDYLSQMIAGNRLVSINDPATGFSGAEYWNKHIRYFTVDQIYPLHEIFAGGAGFSERRQLEIFQLERRVDVLDTDPEQMEAQRFVEGTLTSSILKKLTHGPCTVPTLASLLDENEDGGAKPGTWGEYFRWATIHLVQSRMPQPGKPGQPLVQHIERARKIGIVEPADFENAEMVIVD